MDREHDFKDPLHRSCWLQFVRSVHSLYLLDFSQPFSCYGRRQDKTAEIQLTGWQQKFCFAFGMTERPQDFELFSIGYTYELEIRFMEAHRLLSLIFLSSPLKY